MGDLLLIGGHLRSLGGGTYQCFLFLLVLLVAATRPSITFVTIFLGFLLLWTGVLTGCAFDASNSFPLELVSGNITKTEGHQSLAITTVLLLNQYVNHTNTENLTNLSSLRLFWKICINLPTSHQKFHHFLTNYHHIWPSHTLPSYPLLVS